MLVPGVLRPRALAHLPGRLRGAFAVVPRPDERCGEVPVAVVVPCAEVEPDELIAFVAERVAPHKRVREIRFADAIPRTPAGKILRRILRDQPSYV